MRERCGHLGARSAQRPRLLSQPDPAVTQPCHVSYCHSLIGPRIGGRLALGSGGRRRRRAPIDQNRACAGRCTPGHRPGFPISINQPDSYRQAGNQTVPNANTSGIEINVQNLTRDLHDFAVFGLMTCGELPTISCSTTGTGRGIRSRAFVNVLIRNGLDRCCATHSTATRLAARQRAGPCTTAIPSITTRHMFRGRGLTPVRSSCDSAIFPGVQCQGLNSDDLIRGIWLIA